MEVFFHNSPALSIVSSILFKHKINCKRRALGVVSKPDLESNSQNNFYRNISNVILLMVSGIRIVSAPLTW